MTSGWNSTTARPGCAGEKCAARILCLGNELLGDDSLGSIIAPHLRQVVPADVQIISSPEAGLSLLDYLLDAHQLIVIDTVQTGTAPLGTIFELREKDLQTGSGGSAHYVGLLDALALARYLGLAIADDVLIVAVEIRPDCIIGQLMHPAVVASVPALLEIVRHAVSNGPSSAFSTRNVKHANDSVEKMSTSAR